MSGEERRTNGNRTGDVMPAGIPRDLGIESTVEAMAADGGMVYVYYPAERVLWMPPHSAERFRCKQYYENYPESVADEFVSPENREQFLKLHDAMWNGWDSASEMFFSSSFLRKFRISLRTVKKNPDGTPQIVMGQFLTHIIEGEPLPYQGATEAEMSEPELEKQAVSLIANGISSLFFAIYYISMKEEAFVCYHEKLNGILDLIGTAGSYRPAWNNYIHSMIYEEDREKMAVFSNFDTLGERLTGTNRISIVFRRIGVGWTRGSFIVVSRFEDGTPDKVLYVVSDINEEMKQQRKLESAEYEAAHDNLTNALNRQSFEDVLQHPEKYAQEIGFLVLDVDHFKTVNDLYGHEAGDEILRHVAELLQSLFRNQDLVIRLGGDEFAVLLQDYQDGEGAWKSICRKLEALHIGLQDLLEQSTAFTLSAGFACSTNGFSADLYQLADKGLYYTKNSGRAGCAMAAPDGTILRDWKDFQRTESENALMEKHRLRPWKAIVHADGSGELHSAKIAAEIGKVYPGCTPEQVYEIWNDCVTERGKRQLRDFMKVMMEGKDAEVVLYGRHPTRGMLPFRLCGSMVSEPGAESPVFSGYYHLLEDITTVSDHADLTGIRQALEEEYFCNYYIDLQTDTFEAYKEQGEMHDRFHTQGDAQESLYGYVALMVEDESLEEALAFFDLSTLPERMRETNVLTMDLREKGSLGWLRAKLIIARRDNQGTPTNICFLASSIDAEKREEAKREEQDKRRAERQQKMLDLFEMLDVPGVAFVNLKTREYTLVMNQWERPYLDVGDFDELVVQESQRIVPEQQEYYLDSMRTEIIRKELDENGKYEVRVRQLDENGGEHTVFYHMLYLDESREKFILVGENVTGKE